MTALDWRTANEAEAGFAGEVAAATRGITGRRLIVGKTAEAVNIPEAPYMPSRGRRGFCGHQSIRLRPLTTSKWWSRLSSGRECWRQSAAIQRSFAGIGLPDLFNSKPMAA